MKYFLRIIGGLLALLAVFVLLLYIFNYDYILKGIKVIYLKGHTTAYIDDYPEFANRKISAGNYQPWPESQEYNSVNPTQKLQKTNKDLVTIAYLIIKNDSIWFEKYFGNYGTNSKTNSFSMAKSITVSLMEKAIEEGKIKSLQEPVADFFPTFDKSLTVGDLASMSSGLNWDEDYYNPFGETARAYFGKNIRKEVLNLKVTGNPGTSFTYLSGNIILLGMVIEKATGKNLSEYLSENFWKPLGMKNDALWQLDSQKSGMEKAYCCIASNAQDFARFGKLYEHNGNWNGNQLLDSAFVEKATHPRFIKSAEYGYGFWLSDYKNKHVFYMRGILGQYVIVIPQDHIIIVRLGKKLIKHNKEEPHAPDFYIYIDEAYKMLKNAS